MMKTQLAKCGLLISVILLPYQGASAHTLTLKKVEQVALNTAPEISQLRNKEEALREAAVAAGQLPDPKLQAGIINVPTDTFNLTQENMTQIKVGIAQTFPKGHSLSIKSEQKQLLAQAEQFKGLNTKAEILRTVRNEWLNLYYWIQAKKIIEENRVIFQHLVKVTESMLGAGKSNQHDVLRAQLELSQIENRQIQITEQIDTARARLARWVGKAMAREAKPNRLPHWPKPPSQQILEHQINQHPHLRTDATLVAASHQGVQLAKQQYKPAWTVGLNYSFRQGNNPMMGGRRADFIGAQVSVDLPIFTAKRQDKELAASLAELNATRDSELSDYRKMVSELSQFWVVWQKLTKQAALYQKRLNPEAKQYAEATLTAYQNDQSDFPTVARAHVTELNTQLDGLKIEVERDKARVALLYLEGDDK